MGSRGVRGRFPVRTGSCLHEQSAWCGVLEGVYPPGASTTAGSNYAHTRQRVASTFRDTVASAHQRSHLCGWGRASAMLTARLNTKDRTCVAGEEHLPCTTSQRCTWGARTHSVYACHGLRQHPRGVTADRSSTRAQHATQGRMRRTGCA